MNSKSGSKLIKKNNSGIILINKEKKITSHDVLKKLKKIFPKNKIGHFGTLDPFATGLLIVALGEATKLSQFMINDDKEYICVIKFGENRDTFDIDGQTTKIFNTSILNESDVKKVVLSFIGKYNQVPPIYSAIKFKGIPLYKYARAGDKIIPQPRMVNIYDIKIIEYKKNDSIVLKIFCSKGTYIRSLAFDIGEKLNVGAYVKELKRIRSGAYSIDDSHYIHQIIDSEDKNNFIIPIENINLGYTTYYANEIQEKYLREGKKLSLSKLVKIEEKGTDRIKIIGKGGLVSIGLKEKKIIDSINSNENEFFKIERVFN